MDITDVSGDELVVIRSPEVGRIHADLVAVEVVSPHDVEANCLQPHASKPDPGEELGYCQSPSPVGSLDGRYGHWPQPVVGSPTP